MNKTWVLQHSLDGRKMQLPWAEPSLELVVSEDSFQPEEKLPVERLQTTATVAFVVSPTEHFVLVPEPLAMELELE